MATSINQKLVNAIRVFLNKAEKTDVTSDALKLTQAALSVANTIEVINRSLPTRELNTEEKEVGVSETP